MTKFRITVRRKDLYDGKDTSTIEADSKLNLKTMELKTLMQLFLEMMDSVK